MQVTMTVVKSLATVLANGVVVHDNYWPTGFTFWGSEIGNLAVFKDGSEPTPEYKSTWDSDYSHLWYDNDYELYDLRSFTIVGEEVHLHFVHQDWSDVEICEPA